MTAKEIFDLITAAAEPLYGRREAVSIARLAVAKLYGLSRTDIVLEPGRQVAGCDRDELDRFLADIRSGRPVQYALRSADFCGLQFAVGEGVLIPRPETEELVRWIAEENETAAPELLDIGTGSGAIAVALASAIGGAQVTGIDVSAAALAMAAENAAMNNVSVIFEQADILAETLSGGWAAREYDIVVSNPPYIPASDIGSMHVNVKDHEPHVALFVPDDDPLLFYRAIARHGRRLLKDGGRLYFEIYERCGGEVVRLLESTGYRDIVLRSDINGKERMVGCRK